MLRTKKKTSLPKPTLLEVHNFLLSQDMVLVSEQWDNFDENVDTLIYCSMASKWDDAFERNVIIRIESDRFIEAMVSKHKGFSKEVMEMITVEKICFTNTLFTYDNLDYINNIDESEYHHETSIDWAYDYGIEIMSNSYISLYEPALYKRAYQLGYYNQYFQHALYKNLGKAVEYIENNIEPMLAKHGCTATPPVLNYSDGNAIVSSPTMLCSYTFARMIDVCFIEHDLIFDKFTILDSNASVLSEDLFKTNLKKLDAYIKKTIKSDDETKDIYKYLDNIDLTYGIEPVMNAVLSLCSIVINRDFGEDWDEHDQTTIPDVLRACKYLPDNKHCAKAVKQLLRQFNGKTLGICRNRTLNTVLEIPEFYFLKLNQ